LKRELKVLEIVKREHLENPIRSLISFIIETHFFRSIQFIFLWNKGVQSMVIKDE
jgi:hypothetical protein